MRTGLQKTAVLCLLLAPLALTGCREKEELPFYKMEKGVQDVLTVDGVRYVSDTTVARPGKNLLSGSRWSFIGETGTLIGVSGGRDAERGGGNNVYEIAEDTERRFLLVRPNRFVFGPYIEYFCFREDIALLPPSTQNVSCMTLTAEEREENLTDPDLIAALLALYADDTKETVPSDAVPEETVRFTLSFCHQDYPFLTAEITGHYSAETGEAWVFCKDRKRRALPEEAAEKLIGTGGVAF